MTRRGLALIAGLLLLPSGAGAQEGELRVPPGDARIDGRVLHAQRGEPVAGVEVVLYALTAQGPGVLRTQSGPDGSFAFDGIGRGPHTTYLVGAVYNEMQFPGARIRFGQDEIVRSVEIRVADPTGDPSAIAVVESRIQIDWMAGRPALSEQHTLENRGGAPYYVPPDRRDRARPALRVPLPEGAGRISTPTGLMPEGLVQEEGLVSFWGPVYEAPQTVGFVYQLPAGEGALPLRRVFETPSASASLWVPAEGLRVEVEGLGEARSASADGLDYLRYDAGAMTAGGALRFTLFRPLLQHDPTALSVVEARLVLHFDGAALLANESYQIEARGTSQLVGAEDEPLLRIPLPAGAEVTGVSTDAQRFGVHPDGRGGLGVWGPLPPGESSVAVGYRLPVSGARLVFERRFEARVPLLSVFLSDTGLLAESPRLHRRRPVRASDGTYIHLEAFEVEPGEAIPLTVTMLPPRRGLSRGGAAVAVLLLTGVAAAFLAGPFRRVTEAEAAEEVAPPTLREREALLAAIRDLDHDYETGKIAEEDHRTLRTDLRRRAAALLQAERVTEARPAAPERCAGCGRLLPSGDRFCSHCGARATAEVDGGASA